MPTFQGGVDWQSIFAPLLAGEQTMLQNKQQNIENQRNQNNDAIAQALTQSEIARNYAGIGESPTGQPLPRPNYTPLPDKPNKGESQTDFYNRRYLIASNNLDTAYKANDSNGIDEWKTKTSDEINQGYRVTGSEYTAGPKTQQTQATTEEIRAKTHNLKMQFEHDIEMLRMRGATAEQVARIHAAYRRAGGGASGNSAATQRAMIAAMNEAERQHIQVQNTEMMKTYTQQKALHDADPDNNPDPGAPPTAQMAPVITVNSSGQPIVVNVPGATPQQPPAPKVNTKNTNTTNKTTTGGGLPWYEGGPIGDAVKAAIQKAMGGNTQGQHLTAKNRSGQPIHSDDGGKTWQPGP